MAMAMMLGSLLAVLLAVSATRTHAAKMQQRRAAEAMQLEQMRLAAMLRLHQATNKSPTSDPKVVIQWDTATLPRDVTDSSDRTEHITKGWRVIAQLAKTNTTGQSTPSQSTIGQPIADDLATSDASKRDALVEVASASGRQRWIGRLDLGEDGESKERSRDDRQKDSQNELEVP
jgi:type II secretory pathway pseudopilin PulG